MTMMLSSTSKIVDYEDVMLVDTPEPTQTWTPLPHHEFIDTTCAALQAAGFSVSEMTHALWNDGIRYFGVATLKSEGDWAPMLGLRNCHDKMFSAWWGFGTRVWQCDNLQVSAEIQVAKKRTLHLRQDLARMTGLAIDQIQGHLEVERKRVETYKEYGLATGEVDEIIMECYRSKIIGPSKIAPVWEAWVSTDGIKESNMWSLYNAVTGQLTGQVLNHPERTGNLNKLMDAYCE